jgi:hypothetical protein
MQTTHLKRRYTWTILILVLIVSAILIMNLSDFEDFSSLESRNLAETDEAIFNITGFAE